MLEVYSCVARIYSIDVFCAAQPFLRLKVAELKHKDHDETTNASIDGAPRSNHICSRRLSKRISSIAITRPHTRRRSVDSEMGHRRPATVPAKVPEPQHLHGQDLQAL